MIKRYCFDLDGTLCNNTYGKYEEALPFVERIKKVNKLFNDGHHIIVDTARGSTTGIDWREVTEKQLKKWGVKYHELRVGVKFMADFYIDDKAIHDEYFFEGID